MEGHKSALTTVINQIVRIAKVVVSVNIIERDINVKTAMEKEYVFTEDRDGIAKIVEGHKSVLTTGVNLVVKIAKVVISVNIIE